MANGAFEVAYVAKLARLRLSDEELEVFQEQLGHVLAHVSQLAEVDVTGVETAAHAVPMFNVFREDDPRESFTAGEALQNAPRSANGLFIVTKVVE